MTEQHFRFFFYMFENLLKTTLIIKVSIEINYTAVKNSK